MTATFDSVSLHQVGGSTIDGATYTLDAAGNRTAKADQLAGVTTNYTYDSIYELLQATQGSSTTESYTYDPVGNRLSSLGVSSYTNNSSNELTATSNASYTYDANGNMLTKTDSTGTTNYTWDFENRLASVTLPGSGGTVSFRYDPFGRRIYKSSSSATSIFAYDGDNLIEETNASGSVVARYAQTDNIDEPVAMLRAGTTSYYEADGLGSLTSLSNSSGALAQTYTFDSFGNQTASSGSLTNYLRYTAREFDTETNLYYYRARYYDPTVGRFVSEDPLRFTGGGNFYHYAGNDPVSFVDPLGLDPCGCDQKDRGFRLPDFYALNLNIAIPNPWTLTFAGVSISVEIDRNGHGYFGLGPGVGKSATVVSGGGTANWLNQKCKPTQQQLQKFLTKSSFSGTAGFWGGLQEQWTPGSGKSTGGGFVTPQAGGSYTYSWQLH